MNRLEADYAQTLNFLKLAGEITNWYYERVNLCLAPKTWLKIDFMVIQADGLIEFHEVKGGHWEDDARVKIKVAAKAFPEFKFIAVTRNKITGAWQAEEFK